LMALGAYATFLMQGWFSTYWPARFDLYFLFALPFSFLVAGATGFLLERGVIRFLYGRPLETLLLTWGVSLVIQQGLRLWFGAANVDVTSPRWLSGGIPVMIGVQLPYNRLFIIGLAAACVTGMYISGPASPSSPSCSTSPTTPITVRHVLDPNCSRVPIGFSDGQYSRAIESLITTTHGASAVSADVNDRPRSNGIPIVSK